MNPLNVSARRGEVWWINLDPTVGAEIQKERPSVVVSSDAVGRLPVKVIVPLTGWDPSYANSGWHVEIRPTPQNGLAKPSAADALQVRCVSLNRFSRRAGRLTANEMEEIEYALAAVLDIGLS